MRPILVKEARLLETPIGIRPRILVLVAMIPLLLAYFYPLWTMTMFAPQYGDGLRLYIYSYKLESGNNGQDSKEINVLNHYIGMKDIVPEDFTEFKWIPFVIGAMLLLALRVAFIGQTMQLLDLTVLYIYFGLFSLWSFAYKLYMYGHHLSSEAAVKIPPFTPPMFGYKKLANFEVYSYPGIAAYALTGAALLLVVALYLAVRESRKWLDREAEPVAPATA